MGNDNAVPLPPALCVVGQTARAEPTDPQRTVTDLYVAMRPAMLGYVYHMVSSVPDAEDIVQQGFLRLYTELERRATIENTRSWIYRVVRNLAIDHIRRTQMRGAHDPEWGETHDLRQSAEPTIERTLIDRETLAHAMARLSPRERECLLLRSDGLSYAEIAEVLTVSVQAVGVYLSRGLRKFAKEESAR